ncbi:ABC-type antimicrobial peptide transport system permease subunit [Pedobacter sp. AK013]|uniref:ABC transporter permease n=1 Tax=Pedobacter sp. AK013 TaxID=2723071 RepID=UPI00160DDAA7|nr:ABC transporter permease [Pedobacter sp. AK013]MBB6238179.1 ABC-type antimicrobial peptide transport system permease subunit [Pedobacter sp. AK013]
MFRLNLKIAWRNLRKNKGYTMINILGLSIGMASCILIFIFIRFQLSFDEGYKNADRIYRVVTDWKYNAFNDFSAGVPIPFTAAARNEIAGIEKIGAIAKVQDIVHVRDNSGREIIKSNEDIYFAEPDFFDIVNINWNYSKPTEALKEPNSTALSETMAIKYFGSIQQAIGKSITLGTKTQLKVTGVFQDMPENTSFPLKIVIAYQNLYNYYGNRDCWDCINSSLSSYVLLKDGLSKSDLDGAMAKFNKKYYADKKIEGNQVNRLQALKDIHFDGRYDNFANATIARSEIYGLAIIGLFLICTACINFINLNTAQAINRSKEVGVRKVMGGKRKQLIVQFLTETVVLVLIALLVACIISELLIPAMQNLFKNQITFSLFGHPVIFLFMALLVVFVGFLAGFYPAMIMSGFNPALAIKNKVALNNNGLSLRKILVVVQFTITIILIIGTIIIVKQMDYLQQKPLGFNSSTVVMVGMPGDKISKGKHNVFKERVLKIPGVQLLSYCQSPPLSQDINSTNFTFNGTKNKDFEVRTCKADEDYFRLFDLKIVAGKIFKKSDTANGYVVNETFLKKVGITNPENALGKMINASGVNIPIVGVVKDFNDKSLKERISGLAISADKNQYWQAAIKLDGTQLLSTSKQIQALWSNTFPDNVYDANFVDDKIKSYYESEQVMGTLFKVFACVIIFISFIGLFGLISFVATQRTKEVAIRKVLGASTIELVKMLNGSFIAMVFVANLVAWPLAYLFVSKWLDTFAYRIHLSIWPFILAMLISMTITLITVSIRSYKAANANTIDALKYE